MNAMNPTARGDQSGGSGESRIEGNNCLPFSHYCPSCEQFFDKIFDMVLHEVIVHKGITDPLKCSDCEQVFDSTDEFTYHMAHHDLSSSDLDSDDSDQDFDPNLYEEDSDLEVNTNWKPSTSEVTLASKLQTWVCDQCLQRFDSKRQMTKHSVEAHGQSLSSFNELQKIDSFGNNNSENALLRCDITGCGKLYRSKKSLTEHQKKIHKASFTLYECNACSFKTDKQIRLTWHKTSHDLSRKFKCSFEDCEYWSRTMSQLKKHLNAIHPIIEQDSHKSDDRLQKDPTLDGDGRLCQQYDRSADAITDHKKVNLLSTTKSQTKAFGHHKYVCDWSGCLRTFKSLILLQQHKLSHERRFVCRWPECLFRAKTLAGLNDHKRKENHLKVQDSDES